MTKLDKILKYFESTYFLKLSGWQRKIIPEVYKNGKLESGLRLIFCGPRGCRKSTSFDMIILDEALHRSQFVILSSVGATQAREHIRYFRQLLKQAKLYGDIVDETTTNTGIEINFNNGSRILCIPQSESVVGFHPDILYVDELARIDAQFFYTVIDRFSMGKPDAIKIITSTPYGTTTANKPNPFFDIFKSAENAIAEKKKPKYIPIKVNLKDCPWITEIEIDEARSHLPDLLFRQEILGEFVEQLYGIFTSLQLDNMRIDRLDKLYPPFWAGLDLGHVKDYTAIVIIDSKFQVVASFHWKGNWEAQMEKIIDTVTRFKVNLLTVDTTGIGDPIFEFLHKAFVQRKIATRLISFKFTTRSKPQLVNKLLLLAETGQLKIPVVNASLLEEIANFKFLDHQMKQMGAAKGHHDDLLVALGLACMNVQTASSEIAILPDIFPANELRVI